MNTNVTDKSSATPVRKMIRMVGNAVSEVALLQKTINRLSPESKQSIAHALIRQKRALTKLRTWAGEGSAIAGAGYVKACCVSGQEVDYIFNFRDQYANTVGAEYLAKLFEPQHLIPFLHKQNVLDKTQSIASFALELPDLSNGSFNPVIFDALHTPNAQGVTFNRHLTDKLQSAYTGTDPRVPFLNIQRVAVLNAIQIIAQKGYAGVQNLYSSILMRSDDFSAAQNMAQSVLLNKYSSDEDLKMARCALNQSRSRSLPSMRHTNEMVA